MNILRNHTELHNKFMTPGEKYSKVLIASKKKAYKAEDLCGFGRNTISNAIKDDRELSEDYHKTFMTTMRVNPEWWESEKGDILLKNHTPVQDEPAVKENRMEDTQIFERVVRVGSTEYVVMPKTALDGEYRIMPRKELEKYERQFDKIDERTKLALSAKDEVIQMKDELLRERDQKIREREERILSLEKLLSTPSQKAK